MPTKAAKVIRTRAQRIPFRPGDRYSNKGRIHSRRPIPSSSFFACNTAADHTLPDLGARRADYAMKRHKSYPSSLTLVLLSDTHELREVDVPDGHILIHAGDFTMFSRS